MNKQLNKLILTIGLALFFQGAFAQNKQTAEVLKRAEKEYTALRYAYAIPLLERILTIKPEQPRAIELIADSYRRTKDYQQASQWYAKLVTQQPLKQEWALSYAEVLASNKDYTLSEVWYRKYLELVSNDVRASAFTKAYPTVSSFMKYKRRWNIGFTNVNTGLSEYAPMYYENGLMFVSNRKTDKLAKNVFGWDQTPFSDLYFVDQLSKIHTVDVDSLMNVAKGDVKLGKRAYRINNDDTRSTSNDSKTFVDSYAVLNDTLAKALGSDTIAKLIPGFVNTKYHEGPAALLPEGSLMFTRNNYFKGRAGKSREGITKLKMYTATAPGLDEIKPFVYNSDEYSVGHPAINKQGTLLIFASDMPGGYGGTDLYYCTRTNIREEWGKPVNFGSTINTEGEELFPTLYNDTQLFFSSTGHAGLGGLDIFEIQLDGTTVVGQPANLGAPVNSSTDDFSLVRDANGENGFFTSNRRGNDDIYAFNYKGYKIVLQGTVTDGSSGEPMADMNVVVEHQGQRLNIKTNGKGSYTYELPKETDTRLEFLVPNFKGEEVTVNTVGMENDTLLVRNIALERIIMQQPLLANNDVRCDSIRMALRQFIIYYDLNKSFIRKDASAIADQLAAFLKDNPDYDLVASSYCDSRGSYDYNMKLSLRRSRSARAYLVSKGIDQGRIRIRYFGEKDLVNHCGDGVKCSEEEQQLNRRTQFYLMYKGKNILDLDCETLLLLKE